jgi:hypothetical protein
MNYTDQQMGHTVNKQMPKFWGKLKRAEEVEKMIDKT